MKILPKKIKKVVIREDDFNYTISPVYAGDKIVKENCQYDDERYVTQYDYRDDIIVANNVDNDYNSTYILKDGIAQAIKMTHTSFPESIEYSLEYENNYLKTSKSIWSEDGCSYVETEILTVVNGCIAEYEENDGDGMVKQSYEYGSYEYPNNLNIDLWGLLGHYFFETYLEKLFALGVAGGRSAYLPVKAEEENTGKAGEKYMIEIKYEKTGDYISGITIDKDGEREWAVRIYYED